MDLKKFSTKELEQEVLNTVRKKVNLEAEKKETAAQYGRDIKKLTLEIESMLIELNERGTEVGLVEVKSAKAG